VIFRRRHHAHRAEDAQRHRQIEPRALFLDVGRREIDGHRLVGITEARIEQRAFDALAALAHRGIRHAHGDEVAARSGVHVHFDIDEVGVNAKYSGRAGSGKRHQTLVARAGDFSQAKGLKG